MLRKELWKKINEKDAEFLFGLRERWHNEREYENIQDYLEAIQKRIPEAFKIYKRPFGIDCMCSDGVLNITTKVEGNYIKMLARIAKQEGD